MPVQLVILVIWLEKIKILSHMAARLLNLSETRNILRFTSQQWPTLALGQSFKPFLKVGNYILENGIYGWKHLFFGLLMVRSILIRMTHNGIISPFLNDFKIQRLERINMQLLVFQLFSDFIVIQRKYDQGLGLSISLKYYEPNLKTIILAKFWLCHRFKEWDLDQRF